MLQIKFNQKYMKSKLELRNFCTKLYLLFGILVEPLFPF